MANLTDIIDDAIRDETEDTTPDIDADFGLISDTSATAPKKVLLKNWVGTVLATLRSVFTPAAAGNAASVQLHEQTTNGTNKITISAPAALGSDRAWVFPDAAGTFASQTYVDAATVGLLDDKGNMDCSANPNYPAASKGDVYTVSVAGKIGGASGITVEVGDWFRALADNAGGTQAGVGTSWAVTQGNLVGAVTTAGGVTFAADIQVPAEAYGVGWNDSNEVPTKNDVYDQMEALLVGAVTGIGLTAAHSSDDTYTGTTIVGKNAGATIAQWETVYLDSSSTWQLADANGSGPYPARGMAVAAYVNTNAATILVHGTVRNDAWSWTVGGTIYLSTTAGGLTQTAPSTSGDKVQAVGFALDADRAFFDFNSVFAEVT